MNSSAGACSTDAAKRTRRQERDIGEYVREEPLTAMAIASGVGFILGGGANSRVGLALLTIVGRIALRGAATDLIVGLVTGNPYGRERDRAKAQGGSSRNGNNDD
jgi:DUF883 C-terminal glycine zipper region